jgi:hypothetical protein
VLPPHAKRQPEWHYTKSSQSTPVQYRSSTGQANRIGNEPLIVARLPQTLPAPGLPLEFIRGASSINHRAGAEFPSISFEEPEAPPTSPDQD